MPFCFMSRQGNFFLFKGLIAPGQVLYQQGGRSTVKTRGNVLAHTSVSMQLNFKTFFLIASGTGAIVEAIF